MLQLGIINRQYYTIANFREVCRIYERQGKTDSAKRMRSKASQVFRYAIALGLCQFNVADQISGILKVGKTKHRSAVTDEQLLGQLLRCAVIGSSG